MIKVLKTIQEAMWKRKMKYHYLEHQRISDEFSCGVALASYISPLLNHHARMFNYYSKKLGQKFRL
jgi:hypothetical protein